MSLTADRLTVEKSPGNFPLIILLTAVALSFSGCGVYKRAFLNGAEVSLISDTVRTKNSLIGSGISRSGPFLDRFSPFIDSVKQYETSILTYAKSPITVGKPEGTLNNLVADMVRWHVELVRGTHVDVAFIPFQLLGGSLKAGAVRIEDIYRILPDNRAMALYEVNGAALHWLANVIARQQGAAVSGLRMRIDSIQARDVVVGSRLLRPDQRYKLVAPISFMCKRALGSGGPSRYAHPKKRIPGEFTVGASRRSAIQLYRIYPLNMNLREMVIANLDHQQILDRQLDYRIRR